MQNDFDDIYLIPNRGVSVTTPNSVFLNTPITPYPFILAPQKEIGTAQMVIEMGHWGGLGILHRHMSIDDRILAIKKIAKEEVPFGVAVGFENMNVELDIASCAYETGYCKVFCVDTDNGYGQIGQLFGNRLYKRFDDDDVYIMSGNVVTVQGARKLYDSGFRMLRIGAAQTYAKTECFTLERHSIKALCECSKENEGFDFAQIVLDDDVRSGMDCAKAFYFGADFVMLDKYLLWDAEESDWEKQDMYTYRPLKEILDELIRDIQSVCSCMGASHYSELAWCARHEDAHPKLA